MQAWRVHSCGCCYLVASLSLSSGHSPSASPLSILTVMCTFTEDFCQKALSFPHRWRAHGPTEGEGKQGLMHGNETPAETRGRATAEASSSQ